MYHLALPPPLHPVCNMREGMTLEDYIFHYSLARVMELARELNPVPETTEAKTGGTLGSLIISNRIFPMYLISPGSHSSSLLH